MKEGVQVAEVPSSPSVFTCCCSTVQRAADEDICHALYVLPFIKVMIVQDLRKYALSTRTCTRLRQKYEYSLAYFY